MNDVLTTRWRCHSRRVQASDYAKIEAKTPFGGISFELLVDPGIAPSIGLWKFGEAALCLVVAADA